MRFIQQGIVAAVLPTVWANLAVMSLEIFSKPSDDLGQFFVRISAVFYHDYNSLSVGANVMSWMWERAKKKRKKQEFLFHKMIRSEERTVGKECVSKCQSGWVA